MKHLAKDKGGKVVEDAEELLVGDTTTNDNAAEQQTVVEHHLHPHLGRRTLVALAPTTTLRTILTWQTRS